MERRTGALSTEIDIRQPRHSPPGRRSVGCVDTATGNPCIESLTIQFKSTQHVGRLHSSFGLGFPDCISLAPSTELQCSQPPKYGSRCPPFPPIGSNQSPGRNFQVGWEQWRYTILIIGLNLISGREERGGARPGCKLG